MAYANTTSKRIQVLEQLRENMAAIATPDYFWTVQSATVYEAQQLALGINTPAIAVVPVSDNRERALACDSDEYRMTVAVVGALNSSSVSRDWKAQVHNLAADIQQAVANDRQLSGKAVYVEIDNVEIGDTQASGNESLSVCVVSLSIVYRVRISDVTV